VAAASEKWLEEHGGRTGLVSLNCKMVNVYFSELVL
jgi:hypothetical protein